MAGDERELRILHSVRVLHRVRGVRTVLRVGRLRPRLLPGWRTGGAALLGAGVLHLARGLHRSKQANQALWVLDRQEDNGSLPANIAANHSGEYLGRDETHDVRPEFRGG